MVEPDGPERGADLPERPGEAGGLERRRRGRRRRRRPSPGWRGGQAGGSRHVQAAHRPAVAKAAKSGRLSERASQRTSNQRSGGTVSARAANRTSRCAGGGPHGTGAVLRLPDGRQRRKRQGRHDERDRLVADGEAECRSGGRRSSRRACRVGLRARKRRPATAHRIWALWWSMRPGLNWASAIAEVVTRKRAKAAATGPARRCASRATMRASARNSSVGQRMRVASSAPSRPSSGESAPISSGERRIDQPRPVRDERLGRADAGQRGVEPRTRRPSSSRTVTSRTASSGSPSQSESDGPGPASVATTRKAVASSAQASGVAAHRPSAGQTRQRPVAKPASTSPLPRRNGRVTLRDAS